MESAGRDAQEAERDQEEGNPKAVKLTPYWAVFADRQSTP
jgi:hypothetical protein